MSKQKELVDKYKELNSSLYNSFNFVIEAYSLKEYPEIIELYKSNYCIVQNEFNRSYTLEKFYERYTNSKENSESLWDILYGVCLLVSLVLMIWITPAIEAVSEMKFCLVMIMSFVLVSLLIKGYKGLTIEDVFYSVLSEDECLTEVDSVISRVYNKAKRLKIVEQEF